VSAAARRPILVGGGPKRSAAVRRWRPNIFFKDSRKISFYPLNFPMTFLCQRKLQQNKNTAKIASAARRQISGDGAPINKRR